jgi:hypothetical protein
VTLFRIKYAVGGDRTRDLQLTRKVLLGDKENCYYYARSKIDHISGSVQIFAKSFLIAHLDHKRNIPIKFQLFRCCGSGDRAISV